MKRFLAMLAVALSAFLATQADAQYVIKKLTNKSGSSVAAASVVVVDTTTASSFTTTTTADAGKVVGVVTETTNNNAVGPIAIFGVTEVYCAGAVSLGDYLGTHTVAGQAASNGSEASGSFAVALEAGTDTTITCFCTGQTGATTSADPSSISLPDGNTTITQGTDNDIRFGYDEAGEDRWEMNDGTNVLIWVSDAGTTGNMGVTGNFYIVDDKVAIFGTDSDIQVGYDEAVDNRLEVTDGTNTLFWISDAGTEGNAGPTGDFLIADDNAIRFGTDNNFYLGYDELTDDRLELTDGTNLMAYFTDAGTEANFGVTGDTYIQDDDFLVLGTDSDFKLSYDESTDDRLEFSDGSNLFAYFDWNGTETTTDHQFAVVGSVDPNIMVDASSGSTTAAKVILNSNTDASQSQLKFMAGGTKYWKLYQVGNITNQLRLEWSDDDRQTHRFYNDGDFSALAVADSGTPTVLVSDNGFATVTSRIAMRTSADAGQAQQTWELPAGAYWNAHMVGSTPNVWHLFRSSAGSGANADQITVTGGSDVTVANDLRVDGGNIGITADADLLTMAADTLTLSGTFTRESTTNDGIIMKRDTNTVSNNLIARFQLKDSGGTYTNYGDVTAAILDNTDTSEDGSMALRVSRAGIAAGSSFTWASPGIGTMSIPGTTAKVPGVLKINTTAVGNVGSGEDNLITYSLPANVLVNNGDTVTMEAVVVFAANANSKQVRAYFGATAGYDSGAQTQSGGTMIVRMTITRTGATSQIVDVSVNTDASLFTDTANYTTASETLTGAVIIKLTGEAVSNDDISMKSLRVWHAPAI